MLLVVTNSPQARNLFIKGCSPSRASILRGYCFRLGSRVGSQRTMIPVQLGGLNLEFPGPTPGGSIEGVMGSSVVTRSCGALGAEKLPITRVVPSLVSISPLNKGVGHSGTTRNCWENIVHPSNKEVLGESFSSCFSCSTQKWYRFGRRRLQSRRSRQSR